MSKYNKLALYCFGKLYFELTLEQQIVIEDIFDVKEE